MFCFSEACLIVRFFSRKLFLFHLALLSQVSGVPSATIIFMAAVGKCLCLPQSGVLCVCVFNALSFGYVLLVFGLRILAQVLSGRGASVPFASVWRALRPLASLLGDGPESRSDHQFGFAIRRFQVCLLVTLAQSHSRTRRPLHCT